MAKNIDEQNKLNTILDWLCKATQYNHVPDTGFYNKQVDYAKQKLYKDLIGVIGEEPQYRDGRMDLETNQVISPSGIRNQLRTELRTKLSEYFNLIDRSVK